MIRVVLDTNVLASSLMQPMGRAAAVFDLFMAGEIDLVANDAVLAEYERVLRRPKFGFPANLVDGALGYIRAKSSRCYSIPQPGSVPGGGEAFRDLAAANNAVLVTGNARHYPDSESVVEPGGFLQRFNEHR